MTVWEWAFGNAFVANETGLTDVVKEVSYVLRGTRGADDNTYEHMYEICGRTALGLANPDSFIPFEYLTPENLTHMVASMVNVEALKLQIDIWFDAEPKHKLLPFEQDRPV